MTDKQPEALRLADALDAWDGTLMMPAGWRQRTSAELRRLHEAHDWQYRMAGERLRRVEKLEAQRDALLEAYRKMKNVAAGYSNCCDDSGTTRRLESEFEEADSIARAAIAKAEGK